LSVGVMVSKCQVVVLAAVCLLACGGESSRESRGDGDRGGSAGSGATGNGGSGGSATGCRVYASRFVQDRVGQSLNYECSFERAALTMRCTSDGDITTTETWATIEDAVTESRPVGKFKSATYTTAVSNATLMCTFRFDQSFDSLGRLTSVVATAEMLDESCTSNSVYYDSWDGDGRPTHGTAEGVGNDPCFGQDLSVAYDDDHRIVTDTLTGGTD